MGDTTESAPSYDAGPRAPARAGFVPEASSDACAITARETEVLDALADRLTNREIAARLYVSRRTVESHVASLLRKFGVRDRRQLSEIAKVRRDGAAAGGLPPMLQLQVNPETFFGRTQQRQTLLASWQRAASGQTLIVLVRGEAGIGKSRLVAEIAAVVEQAGGRVLLGACLSEPSGPYEGFTQVIADAIGAMTTEEMSAGVGEHAPALGRLGPDVAKRLDHLTSRNAFTIGDQAVIANAAHSFLNAAARGTPLLLVLEDLHWATPATLKVLSHIAHVGGDAPILVVATSRNTPPDLDGVLVEVLADLDQLPTVTHLPLPPLDEEDIGRLLRSRRSTADPRTVRAETGGNPLLVLELARDAGRERGVFLELLAQRYARLDDDDLAVIDMASVLGAHFDAHLLSRALHMSPVAVLESLERAEAAGVVIATPTGRTHFAFVHALFRTARYDSMPRSRRLLLHARAAAALSEYQADERVVPMLARHACLAAPVGSVVEAVAYAERAAELAHRALAFEEAADHYRAALEVAELAALSPRLRLHLQVRLAEMLNRTGDPESRSLFLAAARVARDLNDGEVIAEIAWAMSQYGTAQRGAFSDPELLGIAEDALAALGPVPTATRARMLAVVSTAVDKDAPASLAFEYVSEALEIARTLDDPVALGHVLIAYRVAGRTPDNDAARHPTADELISLGRRCNQPIFTVMGLVNRAWSYREEGDLPASRQAVDDYAAMLGDRPMPPNTRSQLILFRSMDRLLGGDLDGAERDAERVLDLPRHGGFDPLAFYGPALMTIRRLQGRLAELLPFIEAAPKTVRTYEAAEALTYAYAGRTNDANAALDVLVKQGQFRDVVNADELGCAVLSAEAVELTRRCDLAHGVMASLLPYSGTLCDAFIVTIGPIDFAIAQAALAAGEYSQAEHFAACAADASRDRETPIFLGRELVLLAAARRRCGASARAVRPLVAEARVICDRTGAAVIARDADRFSLP